MKLTSQLLACLAVVGLAATPASAADINYAGQYTYLGDFTAPAVVTFARSATQVPAGTSFEDYYIFDVNPPSADSNYTADFTPFLPPAFTNFEGALFGVSSNFTCAAAGAVCGTPGTLEVLPIVSDTGLLNVAMAATLAPGQYAVMIKGTTTANTSGLVGYSGQVSLIPAAVPEPATMALFGVGLLGAGVARRRRS